MLELTYQDRKGILSSQEITDYMAASKDILARVKKGEERYGDSLGWLDPDQRGRAVLSGGEGGQGPGNSGRLCAHRRGRLQQLGPGGDQGIEKTGHA